MQEGKKRQSNIELLRIISMLMIVGLHYLDKGSVLPKTTSYFTLNGYVAWGFEAFFFSSVNVFFLISGYFSLDRKFDAKKILRFWLQIVTYSLGLGIIACIIGLRSFDIYVLFQYIFPIVTNHYWFATVYFILFVISPLISAGVNAIDQKTLKWVIGLLLVFTSFAKTFIPMLLATDNKGYDAIWMLAVFLTGMYLKKYGLKEKSKGFYFGIYILGSLVMFLSLIVIKALYTKRGMLEDFISYGYSYNFLFCYIASVALFIGFLKIKEFNGKKAAFINKIAGATFGVYLFHEHMDVRYLWPEAFDCSDAVNKPLPLFILHMLLTVLVIFALGTFIEMFRQKVMKPKENIKLLMMAFIGIYALRNCFKGIDLMDAGYSLGNYKFFETMNPTWKLATYLSNATGWLLMKLPGGSYWAGMNFYTALIVAIVAIAVFSWLCRQYEKKEWLLFIGTIMALSLSWAPTTILYHYLGYLMMTLAVMLLYAGIKKNEAKYFWISGIILGLAVFARMPNITYVALIFPVMYGVYLNNKEKLLIRTLQCVGGFGVAAIPMYAYICIKYGFDAYPSMINSLFSMTDTATDYKPTSMITDMFGVYIEYLPWLAIIIVITLVGVFLVKKIRPKNKMVFTGGFGAVLIVLYRILYGKGYFGTNYHEFFAVIKPFTTYITAVIILCIYLIFSKKASKENKILAAFLIVIIFVSPLGGNNNIYTVMNNAFLVLPVSLLLIEDFVKEKKNVSITMSALIFVTLLFIQSFLFGTNYTFHDLNKEDDVEIESSITGQTTTYSLVTTEERNEALSGLGAYLEENNLLESKVILYGNVPAISYIFDMEPALFTTWPDLASNTIEKLEESLKNLKETPVIIMGKDWEDGSNKAQAITQYMKANDYNCTYSNNEFFVYTVQ